MREAIRLSVEKTRARQGGPFGAVVVRDGKIVGRGWNQVTSENDPTAHAEIVAIRDACRRLGAFRLDGCTLYASCEPCPMCAAGIAWSRARRLRYAATRHDAAAAGFDDAVLHGEAGRPPEERTIPAERLLVDEALGPFEAWAAKADRVPY